MNTLRGSASLRPLRTGHKPLKNLAVPRRGLHVPVKLPYDETEGLGSFMSPTTLQMVAGDYQRGLLNNLNDLVRGTPQEKQDVYSSVMAFAPDASKTMEFNYASQALNNSFFLSQLKPPPARQNGSHGHENHIRKDDRFAGRLDSSFGSLAQLKATFSGAARGMFGSGWVWLVATNSELAVVATYGAGTVLVRSREQVGPKVSVLGQSPEQSTNPTLRSPGYLSDTLTRYSSTPSSPASGAPRRSAPENHDTINSRSVSTKDVTNAIAQTSRQPSGYWNDAYLPLLACSIHEHCWLMDHGIMGKEEYLKHFWEVVDWEKIVQMWAKVHGRF